MMHKIYEKREIGWCAVKIKEFKFDRGWKLLVYLDLVPPAILYLLALVTKVPQLSLLFHSYETFIIDPIPDFKALTGILGLLIHIGVIGYSIVKRNHRDMVLCIIIFLLVVAFFWFDLNYVIIRPLEFALADL